MPLGKFYGDHPTITGDRQVAQLPTSKAASPPIQLDRHFRNSKHPDASVFNRMNEAMNASMLFRTKAVYGNAGLLGQTSGLAQSSVIGTRARWRFAFHSGPYNYTLMCRAVMYPQTSNPGSDAYATLKIYSDAAETALVSTTEFHYGANPVDASRTSGWQFLKIVDKTVEGLTPDTDYYCRVSDVDYGLIQSLAVGEIQSMTESYDGYLPQNFTAESQILDEYRQNLVAPIPTMWKRGGTKVWNWTVDNNQTSPVTHSSATATNVIDDTSTTYGASIPGPTFNMTGKARLSQPLGVPCVMKVYLACTAASTGVVHLRDSAGAVVATCTNNLGAGIGGWISSGVFNLPATEAKYYLTQQTAAGTLSTYACSIYEYEA